MENVTYFPGIGISLRSPPASEINAKPICGRFTLSLMISAPMKNLSYWMLMGIEWSHGLSVATLENNLEGDVTFLWVDEDHPRIHQRKTKYKI